jgi:hypothetical protein
VQPGQGKAYPSNEANEKLNFTQLCQLGYSGGPKVGVAVFGDVTGIFFRNI